LALPGVHAVLAAADVEHVESIPLRLDWPGYDLEPFLQPVLARERVRYVGEPIAIVLADTPYLAEDAAELVEVELEPLDVVLEALRGLADERVRLRDGRRNEDGVREKSDGGGESALR